MRSVTPVNTRKMATSYHQAIRSLNAKNNLSTITHANYYLLVSPQVQIAKATIYGVLNAF